MKSVEVMFFLLVLFLLIYTWRIIDPKVDDNYETGEKLLWFNNPFNLCKRERITLWKKEM